MKKLINLTILIATIAIATISCETPEQLPDRPELKFAGGSIIDTLLREFPADTSKLIAKKRLTLIFDVVDGFGNFGLNDAKTEEYPYNDTINILTNLRIRQFVKKKGRIEEYIDTTFSNIRVPYKELAGQNKTQKEKVYLFYDTDVRSVVNDSVFFMVSIEDRNFLKSDTVTTPYFSYKNNTVINGK